MPTTDWVVYCPRCDNDYHGPTFDAAMEKVKAHVSGQHPDHDPNWFDTYPDGLEGA